MQRKEPLVLIMIVILFGIGIAAAVWVFGQKNVEVRRDMIFADINRIAADAFRYRVKPASMGGGGGSYAGYAIPEKLASNQLADYEISQTSPADSLVITARAARETGTVTAVVGPEGAVRIAGLTGDFSR